MQSGEFKRLAALLLTLGWGKYVDAQKIDKSDHPAYGRNPKTNDDFTSFETGRKITGNPGPSQTQNDPSEILDSIFDWFIGWIFSDPLAQYIMAVTSIVAIWLLLKNFREARKTVHVSLRSARAAESTATITRDASQRQLRAYIKATVSGGTVAIGSPISFAVTIQNYGQTPAYDLWLASSVVVRNSGWKWEDEADTVITEENEIIPSITIHPNDKNLSYITIDEPHIVDQMLYKMLLDGHKCIFLKGTAYYKDAFSLQRHTTFSFEFSGEECFRSGYPRLARRGNDAD